MAESTKVVALPIDAVTTLKFRQLRTAKGGGNIMTYYGYGNGEHGRKAHKALRQMTLHSDALAQAQDSLRRTLNITGNTGGSPDDDLGPRQELPHSHSRARGSVAPTPRRN